MTMLRINERTRAALRSLAQERGEPMSRVVEGLVEAARTEQFFAAAGAAYLRLRSDPDGWAAELDDRGSWESSGGARSGPEAGPLALGPDRLCQAPPPSWMVESDLDPGPGQRPRRRMLARP